MVVSLAISSAVSFLVGQIIDFTAQRGIEKIVAKIFPKDGYVEYFIFPLKNIIKLV